MIKLYNLLPKTKNNKNISNIEVNGISCDSRKIKKKYIFVALSGKINNGIDYIPQAIKNGAVLIIVSDKDFKYIKHSNIEVITHKNPRKLYALICNKFSNYKFKNIVGITGTNGKTSVAWYVHQFSKLVSGKTASIGTLGTHYKKIEKNSNLTTPESEVLVSNLNKLYSKKVENVVIEVSSHGLDQSRLDGIDFNIVAITSLSRDHLDYHKNFNNYKNTKKKLFSNFAKNGIAIINNNISEKNEFIEVAKSNNMKVITLGQSSTSVFRYKLLRLKDKNYEVKIFYKNTTSIIFSRLIGNYQIDNLLTAICIMIEMGFKRKEIENLSRTIKSPPGRIELIRNIKGAEIYIDYAHTPDALENVLCSLRPYVKNKLYLVFGCGGDRDQGKRKDMGKIAHKFSDINIITDDNPRYEDPKKIRREILKYCPDAIDIADRRIAIINTIKKLVKGDILLIAGKGHESTQEIKGRHLYFDDAKVIKKVLVKD
ncbi:MAG: UDP-N-acetylmuramoyl-L-alanyl-D-glutamate--2,6-diaminopimelate ligase [Alphaproteobacteria bacterium MarineAlpha9_Bin3]|nr:MAG: UDP-N-acetylmuramoyl-L-alanyl-D-glutamate--2,6-diaminopimelate ligase [Alphaproteobacteria bacterium MarineAlpha9_Bin3]|tara:strand:+ start:10818 stop:12269 length:1452 start_codon:yes stop_codon:yes gene_type:complete